MRQSTWQESPLHVAIIMDGNGRWAAARGRPRVEGHRRGADAVRRTAEAAPGLGIGTLTLHAFSSDNWKRPAREVGALMKLFRRHLLVESARCVERGIRVSVIGRRDRVDRALVSVIERTETATLRGRALHLRIAVDYSARGAVLAAVRSLKSHVNVTRATFTKALAAAAKADEATPDVDLLIRTGGELRLSDLLGWESAYAELVFSQKMWPDFDAADLAAAVAEFRKRDRRFGGLPNGYTLVARAQMSAAGTTRNGFKPAISDRHGKETRSSNEHHQP